jgi:tRNA(Ile)-lysidine synthase
MSPLARLVRRTIRHRGLLADHDRVVVAVSGGPDSVALTWLLHELQAVARWRLVGLVHVHHGLRAGASDEDERFCRALAARLRLPIEVARVDVRRAARERRQSVEAAARVERYARFQLAARALDATSVATGHTIDDQAETVLLRLLRGAGSRGVSAIRPRRGIYVRPLIDCRRAELVEHLRARGEPFREDRSNLDLSVPRNRVRHEILPAITRHWPGSIRALARFAELSADDEEFLSRTTLEVTAAVALPSRDGVQQVDVRGLSSLPAALARRIVRHALEGAGGAPSFREVEAVRALARADKQGGRLDVAGLAVVREGSVLAFGPRMAAAAPTGPFEYSLPVPGWVTIPETGTTIRASLQRGGLTRPRRGEPETVAVVRPEAVEAPLVVRNRRPGDRLRPLGAPGSRKLQDVLVDHKVPRDLRDRVPLVVDRSGRIVWVVGVAIAEECRVTTAESGVVILESKKGKQ